jgi:tRNA threonylcarbamoyladenosine biosynthesis protein TsaE
MRELTLMTTTADATREFGERLGRALLQTPVDRPLMVALTGELGAGKTTLVGGLMRGMGVQTAVRSPTYTLIEPYEALGPRADRTVFHLDLYRLADARELEMLAPRDLLEPGAILLVEWAERGGAALPQPDVSVQLRYPGVGAAADHRLLEVRLHSRPTDIVAELLAIP